MMDKRNESPSLDAWLREARAREEAGKNGMYLFHNGVVRGSARARVRQGDSSAPEVRALRFDYDESRVKAAVRAAEAMPGIQYVRVWLNRGELLVGEDIMLVLIGGDIRPRVLDALNSLVSELKNNCVTEEEIYG